MYYTYVLISKKTKKYYIGYTNNIVQRLIAHNSGRVQATKKRGLWELFYIEQYPIEAAAIRREKQIKSWKSRAMIEKLKLKQNRGSSISERNRERL